MKSWCCMIGGDGLVRSDGMRGATPVPPDAGFVWCHIDGRVEEERRWLEEESGGLPSAAMLALTAVETRPRSDRIGQGALINLRGLGATPEDDDDPLVSIRLWAERNRVISVSFRTLAAADTVRDKMESGAIRDPGDLISALAVAITGDLDPRVADLGDLIDSCETDLHPDKAFAMRRMIARARSEAIGYRRFVVPQRQALENLAALDASWLEADDRLHLREAADRFARMAEELEAVRERSALLHEQLTDLRAEQIEQRTLLLAIVALIFLPLTFITGLFGMNFDLIPFQHDRWGFGGVVVLCVALAVGIGLYFAKAHWFRR
ncbi:MAG TPA: CorA family divalent cation transporter [Sphingomonadaceae bacterium]|nr:CorA family divalent cation transporter [Sphingomonadaceae bacterium]